MKPGERLGKFEIISELGKGGAAVVYLAVHVDSGKRVAVKKLLPKYALDEEVAKRFRKEAQIAASLNHPNVVVINEVTQSDDGVPFIVMEYFPLGSLKERMEKNTLFVNVEEVVAITRGILNGLDHAHSKGVVHRDIKPDNIMLKDPLIPVLTDFGIAKASIGTVIQTATDLIVGTPRYMSPEQCSKGIVDGRSDLYSVGVLLYQLLTGEPPFEAETPIALMLQHVNTPVSPPRIKKSWIPKWLDMVVMTALEKDPDQRFQSARDFIKALDRRKTLTPGLSDPVPIQAPSNGQISGEAEPFIDPANFPELFGAGAGGPAASSGVWQGKHEAADHTMQGSRVDAVREKTIKVLAVGGFVISLMAVNWLFSFLGTGGAPSNAGDGIPTTTVVRTDPLRARGGYSRDSKSETATRHNGAVSPRTGVSGPSGVERDSSGRITPSGPAGAAESAIDLSGEFPDPGPEDDSGLIASYSEGEATCPITVISDPPGARVAGLRNHKHTTPFAVKVPPGPRELRFFMDGYLPHRETFEVLNGRDNIIRVRLESERTIIGRAEKLMRLGHFAEPPGDNALEVFESVLEKDQGNVKARSGLVALCVAQLKKAMMQKEQCDLEEAAKSLEVITAAAEGKAFLASLGDKATEMGEEINASGVVFIESTPPGAEVTDLASMTFGKTPYKAVVPCGSHTYVVSIEGAKRREANLRVLSRQVSRIQIDFSR